MELQLCVASVPEPCAISLLTAIVHYMDTMVKADNLQPSKKQPVLTYTMLLIQCASLGVAYTLRYSGRLV